MKHHIGYSHNRRGVMANHVGCVQIIDMVMPLEII